MKKRKNNRISTRKGRRRANREYKDQLFCKVFESDEDLLDLYNALNGTDYKNVEDLEVNSLEDVIFLGMRNDKSFLINGTMNLYEHNSTLCPTLPLRGLLYFSRLYESYVETQKIRIYGRTLIQLPTPQFIVFYNGTAKAEDRMTLQLSDAYIQKDMEPALECRAVLLNINYGHNQKLMEKCRRLEEYSILVSNVRKYLAEGKTLDRAVEEAVDECIESNILRDILVKNRAEVIGMILTSFDQEEYEQTIRDESYQEGAENLLRMQIRKKLEKGKAVEMIAEELEMPVERIRQEMEKMKGEENSKAEK